jgi:hypothetical protein
MKNGNKKKRLWDSFIETIRQLQHSGVEKQPTTINEGSHRVIGLDYLIIQPRFNQL